MGEKALDMPLPDIIFLIIIISLYAVYQSYHERKSSRFLIYFHRNLMHEFSSYFSTSWSDYGRIITLCYSACNAGYVTCMVSSGLVAGTTGPVGWWAWLTSAAAGCSAVQGTCMATCTVGGLTTAAVPTP